MHNNVKKVGQQVTEKKDLVWMVKGSNKLISEYRQVFFDISPNFLLNYSIGANLRETSEVW